MACITCPAACLPGGPSSSTTRVDATLSARRSKVATKRMVGKDEKSRGFFEYTPDSSTTSESEIMKEKKKSSRKGGSGSTIIASIITSSKGEPLPARERLYNPTITSAWLMSDLYMLRAFSFCASIPPHTYRYRQIVDSGRCARGLAILALHLIDIGQHLRHGDV